MRRAGTTPQSRGFSRGGQCGGSAVAHWAMADKRAGKQRVLIWGDPVGGNAGGKSDEAIVALKPAKAGGAKGRTGRLALDRAMDTGAD